MLNMDFLLSVYVNVRFNQYNFQPSICHHLEINDKDEILLTNIIMFQNTFNCKYSIIAEPVKLLKSNHGGTHPGPAL